MQRKPFLSDHPSFVIVKMSALGDIIHGLCVAEYLKQSFPNAKLTWVVEDRFQDLVEDVPFVDEVVPVKIKPCGKNPLSLLLAMKKFKKLMKHHEYDVALDLQGNTKSAFVLSLIKAKEKVGFSRSCVSEWPNLFATNQKVEVDLSSQIQLQYLSFAKKYFQDDLEHNKKPILLKSTPPNDFESFKKRALEKGNKLLMVCPGSNWENKRLSEKTLKSLLQRLKEKLGLSFVFIYGSKKEEAFAETLCELFEESISFGRLKISKWQALMRQVDAVLAVDSSALHLADIANIPTFSVFGPSSLSVYKPIGPIHQGIQGSCPYSKSFVKHCPLLRTCKSGACIKEIQVDTLEKAFIRFFQQVSLGNTNS